MEKKNDFHQPENPFSLPQTSFPQQKYFLKAEFHLISVMVSTNRKKALKSVSISRNKVTFKNWIPPSFYQEEDRLFFKNLIISNFNNGFHQQKQKLENTFLSKQNSFIQSFSFIIEKWRPIFKVKLLCSQQKLFFWLAKNSFFHLSDIPGCENSFSIKWKCIF